MRKNRPNGNLGVVVRPSGRLCLIIAVSAVVMVLASCPLPIRTMLGIQARTESFPVDVRWLFGGGKSGLISDGNVASVMVEVFDSGSTLIGSGSLTKQTLYWSGTITVEQTGLATFKAHAKNSLLLELYYGEAEATLDGSGDSVTITVLPNGENRLSALAPSAGSLTPAFSEDRSIYGLKVPDGTSTITVTPTALGTDAAISVNGVGVTSGQPSSAISLDYGFTAVTLTVTPPNGTAKVYHVNVLKLGLLPIGTTVSHLAGWKPFAGGHRTVADLSGDIDSVGGTATDGEYWYFSAGHSIRRISIANGIVETVAGDPLVSDTTPGTGAAARFNDPRGLVVVGSYLYVVEYGNHCVRRVNLSTMQVENWAGTPGTSGTSLSPATGTAARFYNPVGIATDGTNLYVTDTLNNAVRMIVMSTAQVSRLAGSGFSGSADGTGSGATFRSPEGIAYDSGYVYVADRNNHTIRKISTPGGATTTLAGLAQSPGYADSATSTLVRFTSPKGIAFFNGYLYVADSSNYLIRKVDTATVPGETSTFAGTQGSSGILDGTGTSAEFSSPGLITATGSDLYVADANRIRLVATGDAAVSTWAGAEDGQDHIDGVADAARFDLPTSIACIGQELVVVETQSFQVRGIDTATAGVSTLAGLYKTQGTGDGVGTSARFMWPQETVILGRTAYIADDQGSGIRALDLDSGAVTTILSLSYIKGITSDGARLYFSDWFYHVIKAVDLEDMTVTTIAGLSGTFGTTDATTGTDARFKGPDSLATDGTKIYVSDSSNHTIRAIEVAAPHAVTTLAGHAGISGSGGGTGALAYFYYPRGLIVDGAFLYIADSWNNMIRNLRLSDDLVSTVAGSTTNGYVDASGTSARFDMPTGLATDGTKIYAVDHDNNCIRVLQ